MDPTHHPALPSERPDPSVVGDVDALRQKVEQDRQAAAPARRAALDAGPALRDSDAADACLCSCHPRGEDRALHDGGVSCPCQQSPQERSASRERLFAVLAELSAAQDVRAQAEQAAVAAAAADLGLAQVSAGGAAPYQVEGVCDGLFFVLRERHGQFDVRVPDEQAGPDADPREAQVGYYRIAAGDAEQLYGDRDDLARPVYVAARAVRRYLARLSCTHAHTPAGSRVCCGCGMELVDAARWVRG